MKRRVAIVGAGVSGLTCGVVFAERGWRVELMAERIALGTTSGAAAAIWFPYDVEPLAKAIVWSLSTYEKFCDLACIPRSGVSLIELRQFARAGQIAIPAWAEKLGARHLLSSEIATSFSSGFALRVPLADTTLYLHYLRERLAAGDGTIRQTRLENLAQVSAAFDLIINCAGIGARELARDPDLEAHRGQVAIVPKLHLPAAIVCDDFPLMYAIPRANDCVFGGTNTLSANLQPNPTDTAAIIAKCSGVLKISPPPVLAERVGLRPFRKSGVRLQAERLCDGRTIIHNYGHGGAGFTLSWGCAEEVVALAQAAVVSKLSG